MTPITLYTERLIMRPWKDKDIEPFVLLNTDPRVCEFYPRHFTRTESLALISRIREEMQRYGFGLWALEVKASHEFIGYTGLKHLRRNHPLAPNIEISWRLAPAHWGKGYAMEAGKKALWYGLQELALPEVVAFTAAPNIRSQKVMERIGMVREKHRDFLHPDIPVEHMLRPHVTFAKKRNAEKQ